MKRKALFLDRDGVINIPPPQDVRYILEPNAFRLMPGIAEAIRLCNLNAVPVVVVTNQKCVATGKLTHQSLERIHAYMRGLLAEQNARVDAIYYCPHKEEDQCACRKPRPGMLLRAAADHHLDLKASWLVGDQPRDIQAGKAAGCRTLHIHTSPEPSADAHLPDVADLAGWINRVFL